MYKLPIASTIDGFVSWMEKAWGPALDAFSEVFGDLIELITDGLNFIPWWIIVLIVAVVALKTNGWKFLVGSVLGLLLIWNLNLWPAFIATLVLVLFSSIISMMIGFPLGIISGKSEKFHMIIMPVLDFMQTMPSFVYLIPALLMFGIGQVPAIFATVIFSMPPIIKLTDLGIRQVPADLIEVGESFGCTPRQLLFKIQLPVAIPTIMTGVNQTMMLALSMVVVSAMIGAGGLGAGVLQAISQLKNGMGFEYGIAVVVMAIILDRILQGIGKKLQVEEKQ